MEKGDKNGDLDLTWLYEDMKMKFIAHMMSCTRIGNCKYCNLASMYLEKEKKTKNKKL